MTKTERNSRKRVIALWLLFTICSSLMIKAVHYHPFETKANAICYSLDSHQTVIGNEDFCPICQYLFSPIEVPVVFHLTFIASLLGIAVVAVLALRCQSILRYFHLRAPPVVLG